MSIVNEHWKICDRVLLGVCVSSFISCAVLLACVHCSSGDVPCEFSYKLLVYDYKLCTLSNNLCVFIHNDFRLTPSSSKTSKASENPSSRVESNKSTDDSTIQKLKVLPATLWLQFALVACYLPEGGWLG